MVVTFPGCQRPYKNIEVFFIIFLNVQLINNSVANRNSFIDKRGLEIFISLLQMTVAAILDGFDCESNAKLLPKKLLLTTVSVVG